MFSEIIEFWQSLPLLIKIPVDFWISIIVMRGIVAKDITSWLEDRGMIKKREQSIIYRGLDFFYFGFKTEKSKIRQHASSKDAIISVMKEHVDKFAVVARKVAIVQHYKQGHNHDSVLGCAQGNCVVFSA